MLSRSPCKLWNSSATTPTVAYPPFSRFHVSRMQGLLCVHVRFRNSSWLFFHDDEVQCSFVFPVLCLTLIYFLVRDLTYMQDYWFVLVIAKLACHKKAIYHAVCWPVFRLKRTPRDCMSLYSVTQDKTTKDKKRKTKIYKAHVHKVMLFYFIVK